MKDKAITAAVEEHYAAVARGKAAACGASVDEVARSIGYTDEELALAGDANLGLGCGNPLALTEIKSGMTVLDLGSGAGFDAFLAWHRVGPTGQVIGVDMTDDMLALARENASKRNATNVEFRKGYIEELPVESGTVDYVISNCVINLSADKPSVFREIARVLRPGGHFAVSDIVLLKALPEALVRDISAYVGCISGASLLTDYLGAVLAAGLRDLSIPSIAHGCDLVAMLAPEGLGGAEGMCAKQRRRWRRSSCTGGSNSGDSGTHMKDTYNVLFLCTGNSARSIMAEAILNKRGATRFHAYSAGSHPSGKVRPEAMHELEAAHLPTADARSKSWDEFAQPGAPEMDFVFTVCDNAARETCPIWPGQPMTAHWGIPDPAAVQGSPQEVQRAFREAFVSLDRRIGLFLSLPLQALGRLAIQKEIDRIGKQ